MVVVGKGCRWQRREKDGEEDREREESKNKERIYKEYLNEVKKKVEHLILGIL